MEFYREKKVSTIESLEQLISILSIIFESDNIDTNYVQEVMLAYKSNPNDWKKYAYFDKHRYTRNLVDIGNGKYNLMLLCWSEGQGSSIHDHANSHCFMKMLSGSLHEIRFEWPHNSEEVNNNNESVEEMKIICENQLKTNDVAYINDTVGLHRVENRSHTYPSVSLHLYSPPYSKCMAFDQRTGHTNQVKVTFYSKYGSRTPFKARKTEDFDKSLIISDKHFGEKENETEN